MGPCNPFSLIINIPLLNAGNKYPTYLRASICTRAIFIITGLRSPLIRGEGINLGDYSRSKKVFDMNVLQPQRPNKKEHQPKSPRAPIPAFWSLLPLIALFGYQL